MVTAMMLVFILVVAEMPAIVVMAIIVEIDDFLPHPDIFTPAVRRCHRDACGTANSAADNCAIATTHGRTNRGARSAAKRSSQDRITIHGFRRSCRNH